VREADEEGAEKQHGGHADQNAGLRVGSAGDDAGLSTRNGHGTVLRRVEC
jgi:hypothetical protein